ncbi:MAG: hypothetical protein MI923_13540 [Phycisphaerales bacterium]|nr:hypothetical protein [Phycisphaerales bacterium]
MIRSVWRERGRIRPPPVSRQELREPRKKQAISAFLALHPCDKRARFDIGKSCSA